MTLKINIIASGSDGNAYHIVEGTHSILIEAGVNYDILKKGLNFKIAMLDACLISHEHKDHSLSVDMVARLGVPVAMSEGTAMALDLCRIVRLKSEHPKTINGWKIMPFEVEHDAEEPLGFLIESPLGSKIVYATDTAYLKYRFKGVNYYMIECNYDKELLEMNHKLDFRTKLRIERTHFEFSNVLEFFAGQDLSQCFEIHLLHLSQDNSDLERFIDVIQAKTGKPVYAR